MQALPATTSRPLRNWAELDPIIHAAGFAPPSADLDWRRASARYRFDSAVIDFTVLTLIAIPVGLFAPDPLFALIPLAIGVFLAMRQAFVWRHECNALSEDQLFARSGWLAPRTAITHRVKLQSVEIARGPLAQRRGYASLHLGLAGDSFSIEGIPLARAEALRDAVLDSICATGFSELTAE